MASNSSPNPEKLYYSSGIPPILKPTLDMVLAERRSRGQTAGTTHARFMYDVFGHPTKSDNKPVPNPLRQGSPDLPYRLVEGVTRHGLFFVLRSTQREPTQADQCVAFTGDIKNGEIRAWPVRGIRPLSYYRRTTTYGMAAVSIVLSDAARLQVVEAASSDGANEGPAVTFNGYTTTYHGTDGGEQVLHKIADFHGLLEAYTMLEHIDEGIRAVAA